MRVRRWPNAILTADPRSLLPLVRNAGVVFLGVNAPASVGDYIAGPSHVLPTFRTARFSSVLGVEDFERRVHAVEVTDEGSERMAIKIYRTARCANPKAVARKEIANLQFAYQAMLKKRQGGVPRPLGDYSDLGAVVTEKISGLPLQSIIMKAALLPGFSDNGSIGLAARRAGEWLRAFHRATADMPQPFDGAALMASLEKLCRSCRDEGLDDGLHSLDFRRKAIG